MKHYFIEDIAKNNILIQHCIHFVHFEYEENATKNRYGNKISFVIKLKSWRSDVVCILQFHECHLQNNSLLNAVQRFA